MNKFCKKLLLTLAVMLTLVVSANAAVVGYVDYVKVIDNYPLAQKYKKELDSKAESLKKYLNQKEDEMKKAKDAAAQQSIRNAALQEIEKRQKDYATVKLAREKEIDTKIRAAAEKVRVGKKLEIMIKADMVVTGGIDCTADIIKLVK